MTTTRERCPFFLARPAFVVAAAALWVASAVGCDGCYRQVEVKAVERLPYPTCDGEPLPEGEVLFKGHLRAGPNSLEQDVVEFYELRRRGCVHVATVRQEWSRVVADVEVIYDEALSPLRVWKRRVYPVYPEGQREEIRLYELRTDPPTLTIRTREGQYIYKHLRGGRPEAVVGPGRGLLSVWIQRAQLSPNGKSRLNTLDFRRDLERIEPVTLRRDPDRDQPGLGEVQVYSVFGRESVFADVEGRVVGDLAGLRKNDALSTPEPEPMGSFGSVDPVGTP